MKRLCVECQEPVSGRSDKRFCSDYCRNAYNNKLNRDQTKVVRNTNNQLRKNFRILNELNPQDKTKVNRQQLTNKGFDFNLFTSIYKTKKGSIYYFVYNQGYLDIGNDYFAIVKRQ
jgi:predicted nucleic acid-binding Zn ribbon protein